jgi:hypothetical protein
VDLLHEKKHVLNDIMQLYNLTNLVREPTRIDIISGIETLLDPVLVSDDCDCRFVDVIDIDKTRKFTRKVMQNTVCLQVHALFPTPAAARYHSKRAYLHPQELVVTTDNINPLEWGWKSVNGKPFPIRTNLPPAPERLIKVIRCNCKLTIWTIGCGDSKGVSCLNSNLKNISDADMTKDM